MTYWVIIPAITALCFKFLFLYCYTKSSAKTRLSNIFAIMLLLMTLCNALEIYGYFNIHNAQNIFIFLKIYYVSLLLLFAFLFQFAYEAAFKRLNSYLDISNIVLSSSLCLYLLLSDNVIAGVESIGYSVTRIPGHHYWMFQVYTICTLSLSISMLIIGYNFRSSLFQKILCLYIIFAVIALATPVIFAIAFMAMGYKVNAAIILPVGITIYLAVILTATTNNYLTDLRIYIPFTLFWKIRKKTQKLYRVSASGNSYTVDEAKKVIEQNIVLATAENFPNLSDKEIAKILGKSPSWLSNKKKELGIK